MKQLDTIWFSGLETIGIVIGEDEITGERKAYIGTGKGYSEEADIQHIEAVVNDEDTKID